MEETYGKLVIIGGAEDKKGECTILREFLRLAGGTEAHIVVIPVASDVPAQICAIYGDVFTRLGAKEVRAIDISTREDANTPTIVAAIEDATGVFFSGGDQVRITSLLGGTRVDKTLHERHRQGLVLGGTSAGAAMMSSIMIYGGLTHSPLRLGSVQLAPGLEFIAGVLIDQHFEQRGRLRRLLSAVAQYPHDIGLGIDEDTAVVVDNGVFEVIGRGAVTVVDVGATTYTNRPDIKKHENLALYGVQLHILPAGHRFDLRQRTPVIEPVASSDNTCTPQTKRKKQSRTKR